MSARPLDPSIVDDLLGRVARSVREALTGATLPPAAPETPASLPEAIAGLRHAASQSEVLRALLRAASTCGARAALFVAKDGHLEGWEGVGFDDEPVLIGVLAGLKLRRDHPAVAAVFADERPVHAEVGGTFTVPDFGQTVRGEAVLAPVLIHGKIAGIIYADPASGEIPFDRHGVEVLAEIAGLAVERLVLAKALGRASEAAPARPTPPSPAPHAAVVSAPQVPSSPLPAASSSQPLDRVVTSGSVPRPVVEWPAGAGAPPGAAPEIDDARRYCRLLMEEILLYHGDKVEEGRTRHDLLNRLADELQKARQLYERRIEARVRESGEYFEEALVRVLANGDARALGAAQAQPS